MTTESINYKKIIETDKFSPYYLQKINYFSNLLNYYNPSTSLFSTNAYIKEKFSSLENNENFESFILSLICHFIDSETNMTFMLLVIGKLYNEKIINQNIILKTASYLLEEKKYKYFFELLSNTKCDDIFPLINKNANNISAKEKFYLRNILISNPSYLKNVLCIDKEKYDVIEYITKLFLFNFHPNLLCIDLFFTAENFSNKYLIFNIMEILNNLCQIEDNSQKKDFEKCILTENGFKLDSYLKLQDNFSIKMDIKVFEKQKKYISNIFTLTNARGNFVSLYIKENENKYNIYLKAKKKEITFVDSKDFKFNQNYKIFVNCCEKSSLFSYKKLIFKYEINGIKNEFEIEDETEQDYKLSLEFGMFFGEITSFNIFKSDKSEYNLIDICSNSNINNVNDDLSFLNSKEYSTLKSGIKLISIKKLDYDFYLERKKTLKLFIENNGLDYLISLLISLCKITIKNTNNKTNNNNEDSKNSQINLETENIYKFVEVFWKFFEYLYINLVHNNKVDSKKYFKKIMTVLYSYSTLQNYLSGIMNMPNTLITTIIEFMKNLIKNNANSQTKIFLGHILFILLVQQNAYDNYFDKMSTVLNEVLKSDEINLECYVSILIEFYKRKQPKRIKEILLMLFKKFDENLLIKYISIIQQFSLKNKYTNSNDENYLLSYKLLKTIFKADISDKINILDKSSTDTILYNFNRIFQLTDQSFDNMNDEKILKVDLNKSLSDVSDDDMSNEDFSEEEKMDNLTKLKTISIRIIDTFIVKRYYSISQTSLIKDDKYTRVKNCLSILFSIDNINEYIVRSLLLISFTVSNENAIRFIKYGFDNEGVDISTLKIIENFNSIKFLFTIYDITKNKSQKIFYFEFIKLFIDEITKKVKVYASYGSGNASNNINKSNNNPSNYNMSIFEYKKIGILLESIIIKIKKKTSLYQNLNFNDDYLCSVIKNSLFFHSNPFFYQMLISFVRDFLHEGNTYIYNYIIKMTRTLQELLNFTKIKSNIKFLENKIAINNFQLNSINFINYIREICGLFVVDDMYAKRRSGSSIIFEDNEGENLFNFMMESFYKFFESNITNPLLYTSLIIYKEKNQNFLEITLNIFDIYINAFPDNQQKIIDLLKKIIYYENIFKQKINNKNIKTIMCCFDIYKKNDLNRENPKIFPVEILNFIKDVINYEQDTTKISKLFVGSYLITIKVLKQICSFISKIPEDESHILDTNENEDNSENENDSENNNVHTNKNKSKIEYLNFLKELKTILKNELNEFYLPYFKVKYRFKTPDKDYNILRVKIEKAITNKIDLTKIINELESSYKNNISNHTSSKNTILQVSTTNNSIVIDDDNSSLIMNLNDIDSDVRSVNSRNSTISIKPMEKFRFKNPENMISKNDKYDTYFKTVNVNHIKFWVGDIDSEGLLQIFKNQSFVNKRLFSAFLGENYLYDKNFIESVIPEFHKFTNYQLVNEKNNNLLYPTILRNYISNNYTRPFLKKYKKFYESSKISVTHKYLEKFLKNLNLEKKDIIISDVKIPIIFDESKTRSCELITNQGSIYCKILLINDYIIIKNDDKEEISDPKEKNLFSSDKYVKINKLVIIPFSHIKEIVTRRFLYMYQACEIFTYNNKSYYINFFNDKILYEFFYSELRNYTKKKYEINIIENTKDEFKSRQYLQQWVKGEISTFYFLNMLNKYSSRSYNDIQQYPIFPWIFTHYNKELLLLAKNKSYSNLLNDKKNIWLNTYFNKVISAFLRDFKYPITAQNEKKRSEILMIYDNMSGYKSHFNSHYSTLPIIYYFLVRISPFTEEHVTFQGGEFDKIERMFFGFENYLNMVDYIRDTRELIPDVYYMPEMYFNMNYNFFGYSNNKKIYFNNMLISSQKDINNNFLNLFELLYFNHEQLNSALVKEKISDWINIIFGNKQIEIRNNKKMRESCNIYPWYCYEQLFKKYYEKYKKNSEEIHRVKKKISFQTGSRKSAIVTNNYENFGFDLTINSLTSSVNISDKDNKLKKNIPDADIINEDNIKAQLNMINLLGQCPQIIISNISDSNTEIIETEHSNEDFNYLCVNEKNNNKKILMNLMQNIKKNKEFNIIYVKCTENSIIYITSRYKLYIIDNKTFQEKYYFTLDDAFIPINSTLLIDYNYNNMEYLILSNFMDKRIKIAENIHRRLCYRHNLIDIGTCICKGEKNCFYVGTMGGYIQKFEIKFSDSKDYPLGIKDGTIILAHRNKIVREIIYSNNLNVIISLGDDNKIFIRNHYSFDLLNVIDLTLIFGNKNLKNGWGDKILLNNYDTLYYLNDYRNEITAFTINGFRMTQNKIFNENQEEFNKNLTMILGDFRFIYYNKNKEKLIEYNPTDFNEIYNEYDIDFSLKIINQTGGNDSFTEDDNVLQNENEKKKLGNNRFIYYNKGNKTIDILVDGKNDIKIFNYKLESFEIKKINKCEEDRRKMLSDKFMKSKGQFYTTSFLSKK